MKTTKNLRGKKWPFVTIDPALNEYQGKIMFPEKLKQANKVLKASKLPPNKNSRRYSSFPGEPV
jgi:hypothetical protein